MREIDNNNINGVNYKGIQKAAAETPALPENPVAQPETKEIKDLGSMPAATIGRSQISSDSTESDMMFLLKNPNEVAQLNMIFDKYQKEHSYEEATQLIDAYKHEFMTKK